MMIGGPWMLDGIREAGVPYAIAKLPVLSQPNRSWVCKA